MAKSSEKVAGEKTSQTDVTHTQAWEILLVLGPATTLNQLHGVLTARFENPPGITTLQRWSAEYQWQRKMANAQARIGGAVEASIIAKKAKAKLKEIEGLETIIDNAVDKAGAVLANAGKAKDGSNVPGLQLDGSVGSVRQLVALAVEASKHRQLLLGEVTDRHGAERQLLEGVSDDHLVERFKAAVKREQDETAETRH